MKLDLNAFYNFLGLITQAYCLLFLITHQLPVEAIGLDLNTTINTSSEVGTVKSLLILCTPGFLEKYEPRNYFKNRAFLSASSDKDNPKRYDLDHDYLQNSQSATYYIENNLPLELDETPEDLCP